MLELHVPAGEVLIGDPLPVRVTGAHRGERVTLETRTSPFGARAVATFAADEQGVVDTARDTPESGDYAGCDGAGLIWSARIPDETDFSAVLDCQHDLQTLETTVVASREGRGEAVQAIVIRRPIPPNVERTVVRNGRLRGVLFRPSGGDEAPPVIVVGGSGGGCYELPAAVLAGHGFAALALAYFAYDDLPTTLVDIPLEYFAAAIDFMSRTGAARESPVGVVGQSRGGELALLLGATFPEITAVVALMPSPLLLSSQLPDGSAGPDSWQHHGSPVGMPLPVAFDDDWQAAMAAAMVGDAPKVSSPLAGTPMTRNALLAATETALRAATIPVERTQGPILMMSGADDAMWPSKQLCELAERHLAEHGFPRPVEHICYPGAGHTGTMPPGLPTTRNWNIHAQFPFAMAVGGSPRETAAAQRDAWRRIPEFLHRHLDDARPSRGSSAVC